MYIPMLNIYIEKVWKEIHQNILEITSLAYGVPGDSYISTFFSIFWMLHNKHIYMAKKKNQ